LSHWKQSSSVSPYQQRYFEYHLDTSDSKNPKVRSTTGLGTKPNTGVPSNKSGVFEKKTGTHKTEGEQEKKEEK
jgi:hypothetical protein